MLLWLLGAAIAGPPFHACDVDKAGTVGFISPKTGTVYVLEGDLPKKLGAVPMTPGGTWPHVVFANPAGGWLADAAAPHQVDPSGKVSRASAAEPTHMWDALYNRYAVARRGNTVLKAESELGKGVVFKTVDGGEQVALWRFDGSARTPLVLHLTSDAIYSVLHGTIEKRDLEGKEGSTVPLPARTTVGLCGGDGPPLTAITLDSRRDACVQRFDGTAWTELVCVP